MAYIKAVGTMYTVEPRHFSRFRYFKSRLDNLYDRVKAMCTKLHRETIQMDDIQRRFQEIHGPMRVFVIGENAHLIRSVAITKRYQTVSRRSIGITDCLSLTFRELDFVIIPFSWATIHKDRLTLDAILSRYGKGILKNIIFTNCELNDEVVTAGVLRVLLLDLQNVNGVDFVNQTDRLNLYKTLNVCLEEKIFPVIKDLKECLRRLKDIPSLYPDESLWMMNMDAELEKIIKNVLEHKRVLIGICFQAAVLGKQENTKETEQTLIENSEAKAIQDDLLNQVINIFANQLQALLSPSLREFVVEKDFLAIEKNLSLELTSSISKCLENHAIKTFKHKNTIRTERSYKSDLNRSYKTPSSFKAAIEVPMPLAEAENASSTSRAEIGKGRQSTICTLIEISRSEVHKILSSQGKGTSWTEVTKFAYLCDTFRQCSGKMAENGKSRKRKRNGKGRDVISLQRVGGPAKSLSVDTSVQDRQWKSMKMDETKNNTSKTDKQQMNTKYRVRHKISDFLTQIENTKDVLCYMLHLAVEDVLRKQCAVIRDMQAKSAERLFWEVNALFRQSKIPALQRLSEERKCVPDALKKDLFERISSVKGCGYIFGRFTVWIEEDEYIKRSQKINADITYVLKSYGVDSFDSKLSSKTLQPMRRGHVGDQITPTRSRSPPVYGTLGGFAECLTGAGPGSVSLCALVSAHVTEGADRISLVIDREKNLSVEIATRLTTLPDDTGEHFDIEAFRINDDQVRNMRTQFMDSEHIPRQGRLTNLEDYADVGESVHIWGAESKPGHGIIASDNFAFRKSNESSPGNYIFISDHEGSFGGQRTASFCQKGDSGSIVCSDDPDSEHVNVLSMLIGESDSVAVQHQGDKCYATFLLKAGLEELQTRAGMLFNIK